MPIIEPTATNRGVNNQSLGYILVKWGPLTEADDGAPFSGRPTNDDRTFNVFGTFGGASVSLEGSLDGVNYFSLSNLSGDPVALTANGGVYVVENCPFYKVVTTGGFSSSVTALLLLTGG